MQEQKLANEIAELLHGKKATDIVALRVSHLTVLTDYLVIATGANVIQVRAIASALENALAQDGVWPRRREGYNEGRWIVMDYSSVIVHIFHPEDRAYYNLERLWQDGQNRLPLPFADDADQLMRQA